jgi:hypothetical protein
LTAILPAGSNHTRLWGQTPRERLARIAAREELDFASGPGGGPLVANLDFVFDPAWVRLIARRPNHVVTQGGVPVLANVSELEARLAVTLAMREGRPANVPGLLLLPFEDVGSVANLDIGRAARPFMGRLTPGTVRALERESYEAAYRDVADLLTTHVWREPALVLTRLAARLGLSPNQVTGLTALLCAAAAMLFAWGWYWAGLATAIAVMVLDTVDGQLARCTVRTTFLGKLFGGVLNLVHPPLWWWAWATGLDGVGRPLQPDLLWYGLAALAGGHFAQPLIERAFSARFGFSLHHWRAFDSRFRLVAARRNPNLLLLSAFLAFGRPEWGIVAIAGWTLASLLVHLLRFGQALAVRSRGGKVQSWRASDLSIRS